MVFEGESVCDVRVPTSSYSQSGRTEIVFSVALWDSNPHPLKPSVLLMYNIILQYYYNINVQIEGVHTRIIQV